MFNLLAVNSLAQTQGHNRFFINKNSTGLNNGLNWENAWTSFASIDWNSINSGDTLYISGGTDSIIYNEPLILMKSGITLEKGKSIGNSGRVIFRAPVKQSGNGITINERSSIAISGIEFYDWYIGISVSSRTPYAVDSIKIEDNKFYCTLWGVNADGGYNPAIHDTAGNNIKNLYVLRNHFEQPASGTSVNQSDGMSVKFSKNIFIIGNKFVNRDMDSDDIHNDFMEGQWNTNLYIFNNYFMTTNTVTAGQNGLQAGYHCAGDLYFANNIIVKGAYTIENFLWASIGRGWGNEYIIGNSFIGGNARTLTSGAYERPIIKNNIFWATTSAGRSHFFYLSSTATFQSGQYYVVENNSFYYYLDNTVLMTGDNPISAPASNTWLQSTTASPTLLNFTGTPTTYSNCPYSDIPQDYALTDASIREKDAGQTLQEVDFPTDPGAPAWFKAWNYVSKDFNGTIRDSAPDRGAFELSSNGGNDLTPPQVVSASILDSVTLKIYFSENLDFGTSQNINNYSINGIDIANASLNTNIVTLTTSIHSTGTYSLVISNVTDLAGNVIDPLYNSTIYEYQGNTGSNILRLPVSNVLASVTPTPEHHAAKTIDGKGFYQGDDNSRWDGDSMPEWLVYDLGDVQIVNSTRFSFYKWNLGRVYFYTIQVSTDSLNWIEVRTDIPSSSEEWSIEEIGPIEARYVKIIFISNNQTDWAVLWESEFWGHLKLPTNLEDDEVTPVSYVLEQNYPNPFNPSTKIKVQLPQNTQMRLAVYNMLGELIAEIANGEFSSGTYNFDFDATGLASGMYLYRVESSSFTETKKMVLLR